MIEEKLKKDIESVLGVGEVEILKPEISEHGDFSTNVAMQLFSKALVSEKISLETVYSPKELAEKIKEKLSKDSKIQSYISKIEVAGPGFINFFLSEKYLLENLQEVLNKKESFGKTDYLNKKRINFEFGQPNTHKLPHIGHLFSYIYGSAMLNILEYCGAKLFRANYQGDVGLHVAKCLWSFINLKPEIPENLEDKVDLLQKMYQKGNAVYDQGGKKKEEIDEINKKIYEGNEKLIKLWEKTRSWSVDYYKVFEKRLGISFDKNYFESQIFEEGKSLVDKNIGSVFEKSEGAIIFKGSKYGLHDRVFLTSLGTPTYEAKDMALQTAKSRDWPFDLLIITTANEQNDYFKVIFKALELVDNNFEGKLKHIGFGMVNLRTGKMSSRTGDFIGAVELVDTVVGEVEKIVDKRKDLSLNKKKEIAEIVGIGAVKYSFLMSNPLQNISFDIKESISMEGNSGPYLQYTVVRAKSVLQKAKQKNLGFGIKNTAINEEEYNLLRSFSQYSGVTIDAAKNYSPNLLCEFLFNLAQKFNTFYNKYSILDPESKSEEAREFRIALTAATAQVLENGLTLLGIKIPEKM